MKDDDLYARYQTLAAHVGVLLHDLRNPLHSATLLVEAMGSRTADIDALRGKLRGQFNKLDALIADGAASIKDLGVDARVAEISLDEIVTALSGLRAPGSEEPVFDLKPQVEPLGAVAVVVDSALLYRAASEAAASIGDLALSSSPPSSEPIKVKLLVDSSRADAVRLHLDDTRPPTEEPVKAPFSTSSRVHLAVARSLAQSAGAALHVERSPEGLMRFTLALRRPG